MQRDETPEERVIRETKDETIDERAAREEREKNPPKTVIVTGEKSARSAPKMPRPAGSPPGQPREVGRHDGTPSPEAGMSENIITAEIKTLRTQVAALREAAIWMSGSEDFGPGGKARKGFIKNVIPLLEADAERRDA